MRKETYGKKSREIAEKINAIKSEQIKYKDELKHVKDTIDKRVIPYLSKKRKILKKASQIYPVITLVILLLFIGAMSFFISKTVPDNSSPKGRVENKKIIGSFTDERDGHVYKTVQIGEQVWMAENMRYDGVAHYSANGDSNNDSTYGFLYYGEDAQKVCPKGWHLPTRTDFSDLRNYVEEKKTSSSIFLALIAKSSVWTDYQNKGGDDWGFNALPAGWYQNNIQGAFGFGTYFWSSTNNNKADLFFLANGNSGIFASYNQIANSVRCLKD